MDFALSDEQRHWQGVAREFAQREVAPVARQRERIPDARERYPWDLIEKADAVGLRTLALRGVDTLTLALCVEELAAVDVGVAVDLDQTWKFTPVYTELTTPSQRDRFVPLFRDDPRAVLGLAGTEPEAGSDTWLPYVHPDAGPRLRAVRDGACWVLNGTKHFINNGGEAKLLLVLARTDPRQPVTQGVSLFVVERDTPGFRPTRWQDKLGQRLSSNVELAFEDCRIPLDNLLGEENRGLQLLAAIGRRSLAKTGALAVGVARGAYEAALERVRHRVQGGAPLIEHQATQLRLSDLLMQIEAARTFVWRAAWNADHDASFDPAVGNLAKIFATEMAVRVATEALQLWGGAGVMLDYAAEKFYRDAITLTHMDGANTVAALRTGALIRGEQVGGWMG
jgi:alkylation response protein AidB-like acyl-CoA dehydrogenase